MIVPDAADFGTSQDAVLAAAGDRDAFARLVLAHKEMLYRIAKSYLRQEQDVEDALSETVYKAFRSVGRLRKAEYFKTWLIRILINECKNTLHGRARRATVFPQAAVADGPPPGSETFSLVLQLPDELRTAAVLFYYEDMTGAEIAELTGVNPATVRTRLLRAREMLKDLLRLEDEI